MISPHLPFAHASMLLLSMSRLLILDLITRMIVSSILDCRIIATSAVLRGEEINEANVRK